MRDNKDKQNDKDKPGINHQTFYLEIDKSFSKKKIAIVVKPGTKITYCLN